MERAAVIELIHLHGSRESRENPWIVRPPEFSSTTFKADLMDVHPRTNGDVRVTLVVPYEDRHAAFALTDAWGANLRVTIVRAEDYTDAESTDAEESDRRTGGDGGFVDLSYQRNRRGRRPHLD